MTENYIVCNCKQVSYVDIANAIESNTKFDDVLKEFESVQKITNCSTGCGGCYQPVLDIISNMMDGAEIQYC